MKTNTVRLNEEQLHSIVMESVKTVLSEIDWSRVPGTRAYKRYQAERTAKDKAARDEYEKNKELGDAKLRRRLGQDDADLRRNREIGGKNSEIGRRENNRRFNSTYYDPMGGRTGKSEREYYGDTYGTVRHSSNDDDWKYGRR